MGTTEAKGTTEATGTTEANSVEWAVQLLDEAGCVEDVQHILRRSVRAAAQAEGATVVFLEHGHCYYADEDATSPLWKGERFPVDCCISGWAMINQQTAVIPDIRADARIPQDAYRPTFVRSLVMAPIIVGRPVGAIGAYWARPHAASTAEVASLERLAAAGGRALARLGRKPSVSLDPALVGS
jgi:precorrin isomerase